MDDCVCWINGKARGEHYPGCKLGLHVRMTEMLRSLEWAGRGPEGDGDVCPCCGGGNETGHDPDCTLAALLRDLP